MMMELAVCGSLIFIVVYIHSIGRIITIHLFIQLWKNIWVVSSLFVFIFWTMLPINFYIVNSQPCVARVSLNSILSELLVCRSASSALSSNVKLFSKVVVPLKFSLAVLFHLFQFLHVLTNPLYYTRLTSFHMHMGHLYFFCFCEVMTCHFCSFL